MGLYLTSDDIPNGGVLRKLVRYLRRRQRGGGGRSGDDTDDGDLSLSPSSAATPAVDVVVVTDSARILGLGDCGAGGMGISEGKILLYTAVGGVSPKGCVPVCLDVGTNNRKLLADPQYKGIRAPRASAEVRFERVVFGEREREGGREREGESGEKKGKNISKQNSLLFFSRPIFFNNKRQKQVLDSLVGELVGALKELLKREKSSGVPSKQTRTTLLQFEDFASSSAFRLLEKFAPCGLPCFNDDVQGTASVGLAALLAALRLGDSSSSSSASARGKDRIEGASTSSFSSSSSSSHPPPRPLSSSLSDHLVLFYGAGEAGVGIGELVAAAIQKRSSLPNTKTMTREQARRRCVFIDSQGLVTAERASTEKLAHHKLPFAHAGLPKLDDSDASKGGGQKDQLLLSAVRALRPTALVGVSTSPGAFSARVLKEMARINQRPIVMPLSNPTSLAECTFDEAVEATGGGCVFASGSPFGAIEVSTAERTSPTFRRCSQANNAYVFPAVGAAALLTGATALGENAFLAAAEALAAQASTRDARSGLLFPPFSRAADVSAAVAASVAEELVRSGDGSIPPALEYFAKGAAREPGLGAWEAAARSRMVNLGSTASRL